MNHFATIMIKCFSFIKENGCFLLNIASFISTSAFLQPKILFLLKIIVEYYFNQNVFLSWQFFFLLHSFSICLPDEKVDQLEEEKTISKNNKTTIAQEAASESLTDDSRKSATKIIEESNRQDIEERYFLFYICI